MIAFNVNGRSATVDVDPATPLLWVLRDDLQLTGTKYGCGVGACGACTVHLDGAAVRSCMLPVSKCESHRITTIEGLARDGKLNRLQQAWIEHQVPQCGYCQSGMLMAAEALLAAKPGASANDIAEGLTNICRCGTYTRIRKAIESVAQPVASRGGGK